MKHNLKNYLIGFLAGICLILVVGQAASSRSTSDRPRYQLVVLEISSVPDIYVMDTQSGVVYHKVREKWYSEGTPEGGVATRKDNFDKP